MNDDETRTFDMIDDETRTIDMNDDRLLILKEDLQQSQKDITMVELQRLGAQKIKSWAVGFGGESHVMIPESREQMAAAYLFGIRLTSDGDWNAEKEKIQNQLDRLSV